MACETVLTERDWFRKYCRLQLKNGKRELVMLFLTIMKGIYHSHSRLTRTQHSKGKILKDAWFPLARFYNNLVNAKANGRKPKSWCRVEFSAFSQAVFDISIIAKQRQESPTFRVENSAQVSSCWLKFVHMHTGALQVRSFIVAAVFFKQIKTVLKQTQAGGRWYGLQF